MSLEEIFEEIERNKKFTVDYDAEFAKSNLENSPCNIWGYIKDLEARIKKLEEKIKGV